MNNNALVDQIRFDVGEIQKALAEVETRMDRITSDKYANAPSLRRDIARDAATYASIVRDSLPALIEELNVLYRIQR